MLKHLLLSIVFLFVHSFYSSSQNPLINEIMASNTVSLEDYDGDFPDWIEIYNPTESDIQLFGWSLTDNRNNLKKWVFPKKMLPAGGYLVVFASDKNRVSETGELHTNFSLSISGEYLALVSPDGSIVSEFNPFYPVQKSDVSFGLIEESYVTLPVATPGKENKFQSITSVSEPVFNYKHGIYSSSFELILHLSPNTSAVIYYTTDGSKPDLKKGIKYTGPILIDSTVVIRAAGFDNNGNSSRVITNTYVFPDHVVHQNNNPIGYPVNWGPYTGIPGTAIADYEMDPELISDPAFRAKIIEGLGRIPTLSVSTEPGNLFSGSMNPDSGGIYIYTGAPLTNTTNAAGFGWERGASFEIFDSTDSISIQADCAVQLHGGHSRRAEKSPKHSFRLEFKSKYGPSKLEYPLFGESGQQEFNSIVLRGGFNNSWVHHSSTERQNAQYVSDPWAKNTHSAMGNSASRSFFIHLYINGLYWGIYTVAERIDSDFAATYLGGSGEEYDIIKDYTEVDQGDLVAWTRMMNMAKAGLSSNESFQAIQGKNNDGTRNIKAESLVNVVSLIDYMILNFFVGNSDWDHHNWLAMRKKSGSQNGFSFFCWDEEKILESLTANILNENNANCPSYLFQKLRQNSEFRRLFADRAQKFLFNGGVLTPSENISRYRELTNELIIPLWAESARWGDYRRDVHPYQTAGPFDIYTPQYHWLTTFTYTSGTYFQQRTDLFISQLKSAGLLPVTEAPYYKINGEQKNSAIARKGDTLEIISAGGETWYTNDGRDPVNWNPSARVSVNAKKYISKILINESGVYKARTFAGGIWSASSEITVNVKDDYSYIKLTEINYHPPESDFYNGKANEFIEIKNTGKGTITLDSARIDGGIRYMFPAESRLRPGEFFVIAANPDSFLVKYDFFPDGEFSGALSNQGEELFLISSDNDTIINIKYSDTDNWPEPPDGKGNTLVPIELNPSGSQNNGLEWRSSFHNGGSPGEDDIFKADKLEYGIDVGPMTLYQNYPNPFTSYTWIPFRLENDCFIELNIQDISGRKLYIIEKSYRNAGDHAVEWNGQIKGYSFSVPGIYFINLIVDLNGKKYTAQKKMIFSGQN